MGRAGYYSLPAKREGYSEKKNFYSLRTSKTTGVSELRVNVLLFGFWDRAEGCDVVLRRLGGDAFGRMNTTTLARKESLRTS